MNINEILKKEFNLRDEQINNTIKLIDEGNTIPFIARYRKEATGALDENQINEIEKEYTYYNNLLERKEAVIRLIDEKGLLTEELKNNIFDEVVIISEEDMMRVNNLIGGGYPHCGNGAQRKYRYRCAACCGRIHS